MRPRLLLTAAALALAAGACADPEERSTTWDYLHASIIEPNCATANCHSSTVHEAGPVSCWSEQPDVAGTAVTCSIDLSTPRAACCALTDKGCDLACDAPDPDPACGQPCSRPDNPCPTGLKCHACETDETYHTCGNATCDGPTPDAGCGARCTDDTACDPGLTCDTVCDDPAFETCESVDRGFDWVYTDDQTGNPTLIDFLTTGTQARGALSGPSAPSEVVMPPDHPLAPGEIRLVKTWIEEGASCE